MTGGTGNTTNTARKQPRRGRASPGKKLFITLAVCAAAFSAALSAVSCASFSSKEPFTRKEVAHMAEFDQDFEGFRFFVSSSVTLVHLDERVTTDHGRTVVTDERKTTRVRMTKNTKGRRQPPPPDAEENAVYVAFESRNGKPLPIAFIQRGTEGRYYFLTRFLTDPETRERVRYINYDDDYYEIRYNETDEPYLMFQLLLKEKKASRTMTGVR